MTQTDSDRSDVVVVGATPGGIAAAVRTAREGIPTTLIARSDHLGGPLASLGGIETTYSGRRAPIVDELADRVREYYRETYGDDSPQYDICANEMNHVSFEPHVVTEVLEEMVDERALNVIRGYRPTSIERCNKSIQSVTVEPVDGGLEREFTAETFIDGTYEGDLAAITGVSYRVGREARHEYNEQHAGRLFLGDHCVPHERDLSDELALSSWTVAPRGIMAGSTGAGDDAVQAYQYRLCLTDNPENRRHPEEPPGYDRERYLGLVDDDIPLPEEFYLTDLDDYVPIGGKALPNDKVAYSYTTTNLLGAAHDYPEADPAHRDEIRQKHLNHALGIIYFLQNDPAIPDDVQADAREWGLPRDEFVDNQNRPRHLYVREARRIEGQTTLTENDARLAPEIDRTPIRSDSVAIAGDWFMDSHGCTTRRRRGAIDGKHMLGDLTLPCHLPYRAIVPEVVTNLLVPVALSATHVAFGTVRVEPVWMHIGESAGFAAAIASERGIQPGNLAIDALQRHLAERDILLTFLNDVDIGSDEPWVSAVQYLGTKGFFATYDARPLDPLDESTAAVWIKIVRDLREGTLDPMARARSLPSDPVTESNISARTFAERLASASGVDIDAGLEKAGINNESITRGQACQAIYTALKPDT